MIIIITTIRVHVEVCGDQIPYLAVHALVLISLAKDYFLTRHTVYSGMSGAKFNFANRYAR